MLTNSIQALREERAKFVRGVEYIKETAIDDMIDERIERAESEYVRESVDELEEAADMVKRLSPEEDLVAEAAELDRILTAEDNITFNEMIGIE